MPSRARRALRLQLLPLIAGFAVLAMIVSTRTLLVERQREDNAAVLAAFEVERHVAATLSLLQDAESGQRGFVLTGDERYLEPCGTAIAALPTELDAIRKSMSGNADRQATFAQIE